MYVNSGYAAISAVLFLQLRNTNNFINSCQYLKVIIFVSISKHFPATLNQWKTYAYWLCK